MLTDDQAESLAQQLEANPNFRVLRKLVPPSAFAEPDGRPLAKGVIVDTETTGLNQDADKIMEIGLVVFEYDPETGQAYRVLESFGALEDPGIPITPEITEITGITNEMVAGKRIDDARVAELVSGASIVIAHNSKFDRPFLEQRFQVFEELPWGCSFAQVDWDGEGLGARKLDYIAFQFGFFFDAHRAETDCQALLTILQQELPKSKVKVLKSLLDQLSQKDWTVYPVSDYASKDLLKARSYYWDAARKVWHRTLTGTEAITGEVAWLKESIYGGRSVKLEFEVRDALLRYSKRPGKKVVKGRLMQPEDLELLVTREMPFGKHKGQIIADLPGNYLNWFAREGFPPGEIGRLLALMQEIDHNGLKDILAPLRQRSHAHR